MELSKTLEAGAEQALQHIEGEIPAIVPIEGTPFFLSETGDGLIAHGIFTLQGKQYYVGTLEQHMENDQEAA